MKQDRLQMGVLMFSLSKLIALRTEIHLFTGPFEPILHHRIEALELPAKTG